MTIGPGPGWKWENEKEQTGQITPACDEFNMFYALVTIVWALIVSFFIILFILCGG